MALLVSWIVVSVTADLAVGIPTLYRYRENGPLEFVLWGLLSGQLGLCCALWLRKRNMRSHVLGAMVALLMIATCWSSANEDRGSSATYLVTHAVVTMVFSIAPASAYGWFQRGGGLRWNLKLMFFATAIFALVCLAIMHQLYWLALPIIYVGYEIPVMVACFLLGTTDDRNRYVKPMLGIFLFPLLLLSLFSQWEVALFTIVQTTYLLTGGLIVMELPRDQEDRKLSKTTGISQP
ncbi:hypothetical protein Pan97_00180 [Bremerella volcania]|uniref:Uncharacterized protein n=1 Tax=Bremerella volcania TaxID=2527984 RepID=A0A518C1E2_9BACT|nr:hypothetical protein [Bremerella volcania]QDU73051.1 hypothetical protein Pan97_00180 [Bremerella volcania]